MVYLFNPENDTALAADVERYTPPSAAMRLHLDGSLLPLWWAQEGDVVLSKYKAEAEMLKRHFGLKGTVAQFVPESQCECQPWGWSRDARRQLRGAGVDSACLPNDAELETMRDLSHRRITIAVNRQLDHYPIPKEIRSVTELPEEDIVVKLPWSSSGRGVKHLKPGAPRGSVAGMISSQGSVLAEKALKKVMDFAALFYSDGKEVLYRGLSIFSTDGRGAYTGNLVDAEERLEAELAKVADIYEYRSIISRLEPILTELLRGKYRGWLGVDMMVHESESGEPAIAPCVEINLRMTMGVVAHLLRENTLIAVMMPARFAVTTSGPIGIDLLFPDGNAPEDRQFYFCLYK